MKTTVRSAPAMEAWHPDWWREPARAESSPGWAGWFACPVCGERLALPEAASEVFCACPACGSGVVAPQPEFGCRAMPYRDWLRLQEIDWEAETAMSEAGTGEAPWAEWNPGDPEETDPRHPGDPPWVARSRQWAAGLAVSALAAVAAVGVLAAGWGGRTPPHGDRPFMAAPQ